MSTQTSSDLTSAPPKGARLIYIPTGEEFTVLCSCPRSRPRHHTRSHIQRNLSLYALPKEQPDAS